MKQPVPIFEADIVEKKLKVSDQVKKDMALWCWTFANGAHVDIIIRKHSDKRTLPQNAYYFGIVLPILANFFGHDNIEDMHEEMKLEFNPVPSKLDPGKMIGGTTTTMSTIEFLSGEDSYVNRICKWAAMKYGVYIPPPKKAEG